VSEVGVVALGREVLVMRQTGQRRNPVHRGIEDQLRPLRRTEIRQRLGLKA